MIKEWKEKITELSDAVANAASDLWRPFDFRLIFDEQIHRNHSGDRYYGKVSVAKDNMVLKVCPNKYAEPPERPYIVSVTLDTSKPDYFVVSGGDEKDVEQIKGYLMNYYHLRRNLV